MLHAAAVSYFLSRPSPSWGVASETLRYFLNSVYPYNYSKLKRYNSPIANLSYSILKYGSQCPQKIKLSFEVVQFLSNTRAMTKHEQNLRRLNVKLIDFVSFL